MPFLLVISGVPGTGKTSLAEAIARESHAVICNWDWLMSGIREFPEVWDVAANNDERRREIGWNLMSRVAEYQLRIGGSAILDCVARARALPAWQRIADDNGVPFFVAECSLDDLDTHRSRLDGRTRAIPAWDEVDWDWAVMSRAAYEPLPEPKLSIDSAQPFAENLARLRQVLRT